MPCRTGCLAVAPAVHGGWDARPPDSPRVDQSTIHRESCDGSRCAARARDAPSGERADLMRSVVLARSVRRIPRITSSGPESHAAQSDAWAGLRHQERVGVRGMGGGEECEDVLR